MTDLSPVKKPGLLLSILIMSIFSSMISSCSKPSDAKIDAVYFAQKHVMEPDNELFKLFSNLEALVKVHVVSPTLSEAPEVEAMLRLNSKTLSLLLVGPDQLPDSIPNGPGIVQHSIDNSFTGFNQRSGYSQALLLKFKQGMIPI